VTCSHPDPARRLRRFEYLFTGSLWRAALSVCRLDALRTRIIAMDAVAIILGIVMFAVLYVLIFGIDRV
jgi:hypothetical protein